MKKSKQIKKMFSNNDLKEYKNKFKHKQIRFAFSKMGEIFTSEIDNEFLFNGEKQLLSEKKGSKMFVKTFLTLKDKTDKNIDWKTFGELMWYSFQTSTYWKDSKKGVKNIYSKNNFIKINEEKRRLYYSWLDSIPNNIDNYNAKILESMKVIF